ncbi:GAF domain-containing sensor histidine kinase [Simiduia litorea]|uniref:GAF domain-containing sensor histidine kinase n=1 Tax=Simiduia litorea TaxID=1435348 RepID=UPI0036F1B127
MISAPDHPFESARMAALNAYDILDTSDEAAFDELAEIAGAICGTSISLICFVDCQRQWFKSRVGLDATETPRSVAFCSHAILQEEVFQIPNALKDERFADNPLVTGDPNIRFYAGAPLVTPAGLPIGTLCVIDSEPKELNEVQARALKTLAKQVVGQLELRIHNHRQVKISERREKIFSVIAHDLRGPFNSILGFSRTLSKKAENTSPARIADMANSILNSSLKVYQLLDELLQWSQHQLGAFEAQLGEYGVLELIESEVALLHDPLEFKELKLSVEVASNLKVIADATLTKTVIRNLLTNAFKYSPKGGEVKVRATEVDGDICVQVVDQGVGLSEALKQQLFRHNQTSSPGTEGDVGHGIGLHLCYEFMQMQQGKIWWQDVAQGTSIAFSLPKVSGSEVIT